jgi:yecA family protein
MHPLPFSDDAFDELADWLMRRRSGITDVVELEGFLTALVIGPNTVSPTLWLPKVWGGRTPKFKDLAEMNRFVALVVGPSSCSARLPDGRSARREETRKCTVAGHRR